MQVIGCFTTSYDVPLLVLATLVLLGGSYVGYALSMRARTPIQARRVGWTFLSAIATGASMWCTHFISMLAHKSPVAVSYDPPLTLFSLLVAVGGVWLSGNLCLQDDVKSGVAGGLVHGIAISAMHYIGMLAYQVAGFVEWNMAYVALSVGFACAFSMGGVHAFRGGKSLQSQGAFIAAVLCLHFVGMEAYVVVPLDPSVPNGVTSDPAAIATAIAGVTLLIVGTGIASALIDSEATTRAKDTLVQLTLNDALTGLPNRVSLNNFLSYKLARAKRLGNRVALIEIDLDNFSAVNDARGQSAGDTALRILGQRLREMLGDGEFAARAGGDEFVAVKRFSEDRDLMHFLRRIEDALGLPIDLGSGDGVALTARMGVAVYPKDGDTAERLTANAQLALHRAEDDPLHPVCFYEAAMDERARARAALARDLKCAAENGEMILHYQPQVDLNSATTSGHEVLLRWKHPVKGMIPPGDFVPIAEETGIITALGEWVLDGACREAARRPSLGRVAVNVSPIQLADPNFPELVEGHLKRWGLSPTRLEIEITESCLIDGAAPAVQTLHRLKRLGVSISLDDFGSGFSSLGMLRTFHFDKIKLDRLFLAECESDGQAQAIVRAVLTLAGILEVTVIAEGVETQPQLDFLRAIGCHEAQGYLLGKPLPADQLDVSATVSAEGLSPAVAAAAAA